MDPLTAFLLSVFGAAVMSGAQKEEPSNEEIREAIRFVASRAMHWAPEWGTKCREMWAVPDSVFEKIEEKEERLIDTDRQIEDGWSLANWVFSGKEFGIFRKLLERHDASGAASLQQFITRFGESPAPKFMFPLDSPTRSISSPYGWRIHPIHKERRFHDGIDLRATMGTPVLAPADGVVAYTTDSGACGWGISIDHGPLLRTIFCHLSQKDVKKGDRVTKGQQIGLSGGKKGHPGAGTSTGAHLHFAVQTKDSAKAKRKSADPMNYISLAPAEVESKAEVQQEPAEWSLKDWLYSFLPESWEDTEEESPLPKDSSVFLLGPGVDATLVAPDGERFEEGVVPSGQYRLETSGQKTVDAILESGKTYKASSIGKLFEVPG
jgi:hypothetical protein